MNGATDLQPAPTSSEKSQQTLVDGHVVAYSTAGDVTHVFPVDEDGAPDYATMLLELPGRQVEQAINAVRRGQLVELYPAVDEVAQAPTLGGLDIVTPAPRAEHDDHGLGL